MEHAAIRIRVSAITAASAAIVTAVPPAWALLTHQPGANALYLADAAILALLALGALRHSRLAAAGLVLYWAASKGIQCWNTSLFLDWKNTVMALAVLIVFLSGLVGAVKLRRTSTPIIPSA